MFRWLFPIPLAVSVFSQACPAQNPAPSAVVTDQNQSSSPAASDSTAKSSSRKVWTNENLAEAGGKVSVVGNQANQKYSMTRVKPADPATVTRIRESLQKFQAQLDDVNLQLSSFKEFQEGETVSKASDEIPKGYTRVPVNQQMSVLKDKKKKLEAQIDTLFDEARKKGIDPGQLR